MKITTWNVNGIRALTKKGAFDWIEEHNADVLCLQEIKAKEEQIDKTPIENAGYSHFINPAERPGYSGVANLFKREPHAMKRGIGEEKFDIEGRVIQFSYPEFELFNIYFPNGKKNQERLDYKMDFYDTFLSYADNLKATGKNIVACGDFNTAHKEIDLSRPKENEKVSGFLPIERAWIDTFIDHGYVDTFRYFNKEPEQYTWWDLKTRARDRNVGWRIDYFFANKEFISKIKNSFIMQDVLGSDHCPVGLEIDV